MGDQSKKPFQLTNEMFNLANVQPTHKAKYSTGPMALKHATRILPDYAARKSQMFRMLWPTTSSEDSEPVRASQEPLWKQRRGRISPALFTEINAEAIQHRPRQAEAFSNPARIAYGDNYEQRIRMFAGPDPGKMAKKKHQIGSLYRQAKLAELELLENRHQTMKS